MPWRHNRLSSLLEKDETRRVSERSQDTDGTDFSTLAMGSPKKERVKERQDPHVIRWSLKENSWAKLTSGLAGWE